MKRKKIIPTLAIILTVFCATASDTWVVNNDRDTIWYDFNEEAKTASVTYKGGSCDQWNEYSGIINIPRKVKYNKKKYHVTTIGEEAFYWCSRLTSITIPKSVTTIGERAFSKCIDLNGINVEKGNSHYCSEDGVLFDNTKKILIQCPGGMVGEYAIPNNVTTIREGAFYGCGTLTGITIPNSVTTIEAGAFYECDGLTKLTLPDKVRTIGENAFSFCNILTSITIFNPTPPNVSGSAFKGVNKIIPLYVPAESVEKYRNAEGWRKFRNIMAIPAPLFHSEIYSK